MSGPTPPPEALFADAGEPDNLAVGVAGPAAVRGGALRLASFVVSALAGAGAAALLFRHLGRDGLGRYTLILSLVAIVAGLADIGLTSAGMRRASVAVGDERALVLSDLLGLRIVLACSGVLAMVLVTAFSGPSVIAAGAAIAGAGLLLQVVQDNYSVLLAVRQQWGSVAALDLLRNVGTAALTAALVVAGAGLLWFVAVAVPIGVVGVLIAAALIRGDRSLRPTFNRARWSAMILEILPYSLAVAVSTVYFRVGVVLTSILASSAELGLFSASFRVIEVLTVVPGLIIGAALPVFARAARDDIDRLAYGLGRVFEVVVIVGAWMAVVIGVGAHLAMSLLGGAQYAGAARILAVQGAALGATFVGAAGGNALLSLRLNRTILAINVLALVLAAAVTAVLVPLDGGQGAAIGICAGEVAAAFASFVALTRPRRQLRPPLRVLPRVALAAAAGVAPVFLTSTPVIVRLVISSAAYAVVLAATRAVPREVLAALPARLSTRLEASDARWWRP